MIRRRALLTLRGDARGATIVEFAMIAPVMGILLLGAFDVAHTLYMRAVLQGIVQKVGRDSSLETGLDAATQAVLDAKVTAQARALSNNATVTITRKWYRTFSNAAAAKFEPFTDTNGNGTCDGPSGSTPGEPYEDNNNNGHWDATGGNLGSGGAKDAMVYTVNVTYPRMFPVYRIIGGGTSTTVTATTVLRNQPYGDQGAGTERNCP
ncbi:pilus assembly protein [Sphingomonas sp. R-74633]|uniref:TadE/TadG family type IV pilus assembly protein n=1 Tax=Sphingomonas sp. R-74633 TaxID=2751188 RepID=UPI0015D2196B|nr:pilus assembly protein [Sphingomonas sp. R-74633]